jgi:hypothetical protein
MTTHRKDTPMNPNDTPKIHVHTSDDGPCGYCSGNDCPMRYCPGCPPGCALAEDESGATTTPTHDGRAWAAREEGSSWLDKM